MHELALAHVAARRMFLAGALSPDRMLLPEYKRMTREEARAWAEEF